MNKWYKVAIAYGYWIFLLALIWMMFWQPDPRDYRPKEILCDVNAMRCWDDYGELESVWFGGNVEIKKQQEVNAQFI